MAIFCDIVLLLTTATEINYVTSRMLCTMITAYCSSYSSCSSWRLSQFAVAECHNSFKSSMCSPVMTLRPGFGRDIDLTMLWPLSQRYVAASIHKYRSLWLLDNCGLGHIQLWRPQKSLFVFSNAQVNNIITQILDIWPQEYYGIWPQQTVADSTIWGHHSLLWPNATTL